MLIVVPGGMLEMFIISRCENDYESVTHKLTKILFVIKRNRFHVAFFWMFLDSNPELRLASEDSRDIITISHIFSYFCLGYHSLYNDAYVFKWDNL